MRKIILMLLTLILCTLVVVGQTPGSKVKSAIDKQKETSEDVKSLEAKMQRIADKLKEIHPYYSEKLLQALELLKKDLLSDDVREIITLLENNLLGKAIVKGEDVEKDLAKLLAFLEDKMNIKDVNEKIKSLGALMEEVQKIKEEEEKIRKATEQADSQQNKVAQDLINKIDKLLAEQEALREKLALSDNQKPKETLEKMLEKTAELIKEQEKIIEETSAAEKGDLKQVGEFIDQLNSLINKQSDILNENKSLQQNEEGLNNALKQLDDLIEAQKSVMAASEKAINNPSEAQPDELGKQQENIVKNAFKAVDLLEKLPLDKKSDEAKKLLAHAVVNATQASENLGDELYDIAKPEQSKALDNLENARSSLQKLADELNKEKSGKLAIMAETQGEMQNQTKSLSEAMKLTAQSSNQPAMSQIMNKASAQSISAAQNMGNAKKQLNQTNQKEAEPEQSKALNDLKDAKSTLDSLRQQLAKSEKELFKPIEEKQGKLGAKTDDLVGGLVTIAVQMQTPSSQQNILNVANHATQAGQSMNKSQQELGQNNSRAAQHNQQNALKELNDTQKALKELQQELAKTDESKKLDDLAQQQAELSNKAENLTKQIQQAANQSGANQQSKQSMNQASQNAQNACSQMSQASNNMKQSNQSGQQGNQQARKQQQQQAQANQKKAEEELAKAKEEIEKLKKRPLTDEEKRQLERLAKRQKEIEEKTKKVSEEAKKQNEENASQSAKNAANKMGAASQSMSQGASKQAQSEQDEAIEELERMYEELARKQSELSQQQKEQLLEKLDQMLTKIISKQNEINDETIRLDQLKLKEGELPRNELINLKKIAQAQNELADETTSVNEKLLKEHSTVFSWVLKTVIDDMVLVKDLLENNQRTDDYTQGFQQDILRKLKELLDALKKEKSKIKPGGQSGGGGGGG